MFERKDYRTADRVFPFIGTNINSATGFQNNSIITGAHHTSSKIVFK